MIKEQTIKKYTEILLDIEKSGLSVNKYFENLGKNPASFYITMRNVRIEAEKGIKELQDLINLYDRIKGTSNYREVESSGEGDRGIELDYVRDEDERIIQYIVTVPVKDSVPFHATLSREEVETIYGLYTYYGGNITARNVANEFPRFTLPEIKKLFRAFGLYKDSIWAPRHLVEELSIEQLSNYRMSLKERAAFKYADAQQERDFNLQIKKMAKRINELTDQTEFVNNLIKNGIEYKTFNINQYQSDGKVGVVFLSDLHIGATNTANGYLPLPTYDRKEIERRLTIVLNNIASKDWTEIIIVNMGDSVDSLKGTTAKGTPLPTIYSDKEMSEMYFSIMLSFFKNLYQINSSIKYFCIGDSNHDGIMQWINNVALVPHLTNMGIECYVSPNPIDTFDVGEYSITYLHGHDSKTQFKGFPLHLDEKTRNWFNNYYLDSDYNFKSKKIVVKGDLHQFAVNSCSTFDYINVPSLYGCSQWIVSNFGKTAWGIAYLEFNNNSYQIGQIKE